ncbi:MAG: hypothetical protein HFJ60_05435 [Clostridia bacterium]|jgi:hypothetical protein|nr:hypothetical protein [Clostridia bacterium]
MKKDYGYILIIEAEYDDGNNRYECYFIPLEEVKLATYLYDVCKKLIGTEWEEDEEISDEEKNFIRDFIPEDEWCNAHTITRVAIFKRENGETSKTGSYELGEAEFEDIEDSNDAYYYRCSPIDLFE